MKTIKTSLINPFGAPIYHILETESTMTDAHILSAAGEKDGTTVYADFQSKGRGRVEGRKWNSSVSENLLCTTLLRRSPITGFTLRVGLAVALTLDTFLPIEFRTQIKWPNDILVRGKKIGGIICENDSSILYIGTGINIAQTIFPAELADKATSLVIISSSIPSVSDVLLCYLENLQKVLILDDWHNQITQKLYRQGEIIRFLSGDPEKKEILEGYLEGIGVGGELLFRPLENGPSTTLCKEPLHLFSGEIIY